MILIAIILPGLYFLLRGKIISSIVAFALQIIAILLLFVFFGFGFMLWLTTALWACISYSLHKRDRRIKKLEFIVKGLTGINKKN